MADGDLFFLFFHRMMVESDYCNSSNVIYRKDALTVISKWMRFSGRNRLKEDVLNGMISKGWLSKINRDKLRVKQVGLSKGLEDLIKD